MQKENKNQEDSSPSGEKNLDKIDYTIQTMDSDLKGKSPEKRSVKLLDLEKKEVEKEKSEEALAKKPEKKPQPKKNFNPFLDDLQPIEKFKSMPQEPETTKVPNPPSPENKKELKKNTSKIPKPPNTNPHSPVGEKKSPNFLLIFLLMLSLTAIGAGVYYYFHLNSSKPKEPVQEESPVEEPPVEEPVVEDASPKQLRNSQVLNIKEDSSLVELIRSKKENLSVSTSEYYEIKEASEKLSSSEILSLLDIKLPEEVLNNLSQAWIMTYNQENVLKINLVLEITQDPDKTEEFVMNNEYRLLQLLKPLFIDEDFVLKDEEIVFKDSAVLEGIRYYNLVEGFNNKAIDWGIIDEKYLIFTTSKETARVLLEEIGEGSSEKSTQLKTETETSNEKASQMDDEDQNSEVIFADKLSSCTEYKMAFEHLLTEELLEKEILGKVNDKCSYVEQMPNNGKMECKYNTNQRTVAAQYYKDLAVAESFEASVNSDSDNGEQKTTYTVDGKEVENPIQTFMDDGICVVSGY